MSDPIQPAHYRQHPSGVEAIEITEHFNFCLGNAIKYVWRAGLKGEALEDLRKARYYIEREIERITKEQERDAAGRADEGDRVGPGLPAADGYASVAGWSQSCAGCGPVGSTQDSEALSNASRDDDSGRGSPQRVWFSDPVDW